MRGVFLQQRATKKGCAFDGRSASAGYLMPRCGSCALPGFTSAILLILLAGILIAASLSKLIGLAGGWGPAVHADSMQTAIAVVHYRLYRYIPLGYSEFVGVVAAVELALGVSLITVRKRKSVVISLAALVFAAFTLALVLSRSELAGRGCGCIGAGVLEFPTLSANVVRNGVLMVGCLILAQVWNVSVQSVRDTSVSDIHQHP